MFCAKVEPMVHALAKKYDGRMQFEVKNYKEGDSPAKIAEYGLEVHGMVITDASGAKLWHESGHKQTRDVVEAAIEKVLAKK